MYFSDIIGHENVKENLKNLVRSGKAGHAYIFTGPKGTGKYKTALAFANALMCEDFTDDSCGNCKDCHLIFANAHPDLKAEDYSSDAEGKVKASISVEAVRGFKTDVYLKPFYSKRKIYILDNADKLTTEAQNALLKIFEEPPLYATVILICHNLSKMLPTIISRAVLVKFSALSPEELEIYLDKYYNDIGGKSIYSRISNGSVATMIKNIEDENALELRKSVLDGLIEIFTTRRETSVNSLFGVFMKNEDKKNEIIGYISSFVMDCLYYKTRVEENIVNTDMILEISLIVREIKIGEVLEIQKLLVRLSKKISENANYKLAVLDTLIRMKEEIYG